MRSRIGILSRVCFLAAMLFLPTGTFAAEPETKPTNSFGIYLFASTIEWQEALKSWSTEALAKKPLISDADIVTYHFTNHVITLTHEAAARLEKELPPRRLVTPFVVVADGERVYLGAFVSLACSASIPLPSISIMGEPQWITEDGFPPNSISLSRTYAARIPDGQADPRIGERVKRSLAALKKLK